MSFRRILLSVFLTLALMPRLSAQTEKGQTDSVVVLMSAKSLEMITLGGEECRRALDANFLHNNTYLICDSAVWHVDRRVINAFGNVKILQDRTVLTSDQLDYMIDLDLATFRGQTVQLKDKDGNTLRTRYLDYNTKDSLAIFSRGGSMRDKDGQVIESVDGTYEAKNRLFTFSNYVNMYTDTVFIKTRRLDYHTDIDVAEFEGSIDAWRGHDMLSSDFGRYEKRRERFFFRDNVHVMSETQEGWADSLYFDRLTNGVEMYGNVQVTDTTRNVSALSDKLVYVDSLSRVTLEKNAAVVARTEEKGQVDTIYVGADRFVYHTIPKCDIPAPVVSDSDKRLKDLDSDPVSAYRATAAQEAANRDSDSGEEDPNDPEAAARRRAAHSAAPPTDNLSADSVKEKAAGAPVESLQLNADDLGQFGGEQSENLPDGLPEGLSESSDSLRTVTDSLNIELPVLSHEDSLAMAEQALLDSIAMAEQARLDSIATAERARLDSLANRDTTKIGFLTALGKVKLFRKDMQAVCDSLEYSDLDSLARLYKSPVVWNEGNRQYSSDSLYVIIKNQRMERASLMSDAFIIIQEDTLCFDQIKSAEIMAYFDTTSTLKRFDALGGANALFYLKENDAFATVNKVESKMLSARFIDGEIDRIFYFDSPKNDAYPVVQLPKGDREMKGFNWQPDLRPAGKEDITTLELRPSERVEYLGHPMPPFNETNFYFPGHIKSVRKMLAQQDSLRAVRHREAELRRQQAIEAERMAADSLAAPSDSLAFASDSLRVLSDSLAVSGPMSEAADSLKAVADSLAGAPAVPDSLSMAADSAAIVAPPVPERDPREVRREEAEARRKEAEEKRQARADAREARWAELDARDAAKAAAKDAKALEKKRRRTYKAVLVAERENAKDQKKLERYIRRYEMRLARKAHIKD